MKIGISEKDEKEFIAHASHELRTPIAVIRGFAEILQSISKVSPSTLKEISEKIIHHCDRMNKLIQSLLTLAHLESMSQSNFYPCDLAALIDNCAGILLRTSPDVQITIEKPSYPLVIDAHPDLLELALMNLLENGVKYSASPAELTIRLQQKTDEVMITVQDQGIGMPEKALPRIFDRFYTVEHSRGKGLGLSIVKMIIERHRGVISVSSTQGKGSTFTLMLPMNLR